MSKPAEIAVFIGENGNTAKFYGEGKIVVFAQDNETWTVSREKGISLKEIQGMIDFGQKMEEILAFLGRCRIFVGLSITGIAYHFLEKAKFSIWEYDGDPYEFFDYLLFQEQLDDQKISKKDLQEAEANKTNTSEENIPEDYSIFIKGIQEKNARNTSKQVLLPFLRRGSFETLEIVCNQIPVWLEEEVFRRRLSLQTQQIDRNKVKIILKR